MYKKIIAVFLITVLIALSFASCSKTVKMTFAEDGTLRGGKSTYKYAPVGYEPAFKGEKYGKIKGTMEEDLYTIGKCDPKKWLATEYAGAATLVYYAADIDLPTLKEMKPEKCFVCESETNSYSIYTLGAGKDVSKEQEVIKALTDKLSKGESDEIWPRSDVTKSLSLKFYSDKWEAIYYNVTYAECSDCNIIYDRVQDVCVTVGDLLKPYIENSYEN